MTDRVDPTAVVERGALVNKQVFALQLQPFKTDGEKQAVSNFLRASADIASYLMEHKRNADALANLEIDQLRPLAVEVRAYSLRRHLTCCTPVWAAKTTTRANEFVTFSGAELKAAVAALAEPLGLTPIDTRAAGTPDRIRWDAVSGSNFGLFDFRRENHTEGRWASISHALGLALSVGTLPVILTDGKWKLPFDVHIDPVDVPLTKEARRIISDAMATAAVAQFQIEIQGSSILQTIDYVLDQVGDHLAAARYMRPYVEALKNTEPPDPVNARLYLKSLLDQAGGGDYELLTPMWPGTYPNRNAPCCFHVVPFALPDAISRAVEAGCRSAVVYARGDTTGDVDIIEGIWRGIGQASHVVVDLTPVDVNGSAADASPNPNVCLELAIAQALGRKLLLVRDARAKDAPLFPEIAKLQVLPYASTGTLTKYVERFVT